MPTCYFQFNFQTANFFKQTEFSKSQIVKQPDFQQPKFSNEKTCNASHHQNMSSCLAARCARVVESTSAHLGVVTPRGRAGCRVPDAPAALCAKRGSTSAHKYSQRRHRKTRQSRTRWCYNLYRALLGEVLYCARRSTEDGLSGPVGPTNLRRNYPSIRGGTTRFKSPQQAPFVLRDPSSAHRLNLMATRPAN